MFFKMPKSIESFCQLEIDSIFLLNFHAFMRCWKIKIKQDLFYAPAEQGVLSNPAH